jgi:hypothetical protein
MEDEMNNGYGNHDSNSNEEAAPKTPDHQREDQPLKELNEDPDEAENNTADDDDRRNAQGEHEGSPHDPVEFEPVNPVVPNTK